MSVEDDPLELDADALAMIAAYRRDETMPDDLEDAVWSRLQPDTVEKAGGFARWGIVALAAAAAVVAVVVGAKSFTPTELSADAKGQQAPYEGRVRDPAGVVDDRKAVPKKQPSRSGAAAAPEVIVAPTEPEPEPEPEPVADTSAPLESVAPSRRKRSGATRAPQTPPPAVAPSADTLAEETRLLRQAQGAMKAGAPRKALSILASCEKKFPNGVLLEERGALKVIALCAAGDTKAGRAAASVFLSKRPRSALAPRVRDACSRAD